MNHSSHRQVFQGVVFDGQSSNINGHQYVGAAPDVDGLRALLRDHRAELERLAGPRADRAGYQIDEVEEALAEERPDGSRVRHAWEAVKRLLQGGAEGAESVARIGAAVGSLFPQ